MAPWSPLPRRTGAREPRTGRAKEAAPRVPRAFLRPGPEGGLRSRHPRGCVPAGRGVRVFGGGKGPPNKEASPAGPCPCPSASRIDSPPLNVKFPISGPTLVEARIAGSREAITHSLFKLHSFLAGVLLALTEFWVHSLDSGLSLAALAAHRNRLPSPPARLGSEAASSF